MTAKSTLWLTALLSLCGLSVGSHIYTLIPISNELALAFHVSIPTIASASSVFSLFYAIGFMVFGPLSEKVGRRPVMQYGMLTLAVTTFSVTFAHSLGWLLTLRALQGFVASSCAPVAIAYVFEIYAPEKRTTATAFVTTSFLMAGIVGQVVSTWLTHAYGWTAVFTVLASLHLVIFMFIRMMPNPQIAHKDLRVLHVLKHMLDLLRHIEMVKLYVVTLTLLLAFVSFYSALSGYVENTFHLDKTQVLLLRSIGIVGMLPSPLAGRFVQRFGAKQTLISGFLLTTVGLLFVKLMPTVSLIGVSSIVFVFGITVTMPTLIGIVGIRGGAHRGQAVALFMFILFLGASIGPVLASLTTFSGVILVLVALLSIAILVSFRIRIAS